MAPTYVRRSTVPSSSLSRKLTALAGAGGAFVGGVEAEAVTYTPTTGVVAAQGIPGFSFVDASTVTLGNLRGPAASGSVGWDVDGVGGTNFELVNNLNMVGSFVALGNSNSILFGSTNTANPVGLVRNIATGNAIGSGQSIWKAGAYLFTYVGGVGQGVAKNFSSTSGQFGFRFTDAADTYYGWASMVVDGVSAGPGGQGFQITEAYYQSTPGGSINVGAVPVPEPTGIALLAIGSAGVLAWRARREARPDRGLD